MMTREQVQAANEYHADGCYVEVGPRGGLTYHVERWRASGQFQPRPRAGDWFQPVKHGMYESSHIDANTTTYFHSAGECALDHGWDSGAWLVYAIGEDFTAWTASYRQLRQPTTYRVGYFEHGKLAEVAAHGLSWQAAHELASSRNAINSKPALAAY